MPAVFISHASADGALATSVKEWLNQLGYDNIFLDLDKGVGIQAGENWEQRLYAEVNRCHAVILVLTPAWNNSKWCFAEFSMARSLGKLIFPIIAPDVDPGFVGPEIGAIQMESWTTDGKNHLAERLGAVAHEIARGHRFDQSRPPYPGFFAFEPEDAAIFFGRDPEIRKISERLEARRVQGGAKLLLVVGPSGSGKSSVVRAGVLPWLSRDRRRWVVAPAFRPGETPLLRLGRALSELDRDKSDGAAWFKPDSVSHYQELSDFCARICGQGGGEATLLITIDQFEEVYSLANGEEQRAFLALLNAISDGPAPILLLATVRSDMMGEILKSASTAVRHEVFTLGQLPADRLPQIIEGPARVAALQLENGLVQRIIRDASDTDALPLLAFTLREMYDRFGQEGSLSVLSYEVLGDPSRSLSPLENAIRLKAEETISAHAPSGQQLNQLKEAFVGHLARVNDEGLRLRRQAKFDDLPAAAMPLINQLIEARLLSARGLGEDRIVEVAHEALFRAWPQLSTWLEEEQDFLVGQRNIEQSKQIYDATSEAEQSKALLVGLLLERARDWVQDHPARMGNVRAYVELSIKADDERIDKQKRRQRGLTIMASAMAFVFAVLGVLSMFQWNRAEQAAQQAAMEAERAGRSEEVAALARAQAESRFAMALGAVATGLSWEDPWLALFLSGEAITRAGDGASTPDARSALLKSRIQLSSNSPHVWGSPISVGDALSLALSPDGEVAAIGNRDGEIKLVDRASRTATQTSLKAHEGGVEDLEFSPDGNRLASAGSSGKVMLWRVQDGKIINGERLSDIGDVAWAVSFDQSGERIAASSENGEVRVWDIRSSIPVVVSRLLANDDLLSVQFSPDGESIVAGSGSGNIYGWRLDTGEPLFPPVSGVHTSDVWSIEFSADGTSFSTQSSDGSSKVLSFPDGKLESVNFPSDENIQSTVLLEPRGTSVGGGIDGRLRWQVDGQDSAYLTSAAGHADRIVEVDGSADGRILASLGRDQNLRFWTAYDPLPMMHSAQTDGAAKGIATARDGSLIAAGDKDGSVYVWRDDLTKMIKTDLHGSGVWALAISSDSQQIATADRSGSIRLWDTGLERSTLVSPPGESAVWWIGFTAENDQLIAAGDQGLLVYDITESGSRPSEKLSGTKLTGAVVSPDGGRLAAISAKGEVTLLALPGLQELATIKIVDDLLWNASFSNDGKLLAVAGANETVTLLHSDTGEPVAELGGHSGGATDVAFMPDNQTLVASDRKGKLHFWDFATGRPLTVPLKAHRRTIWRLDVNEQGLLVSSGDDGVVRSWSILDIQQACDVGLRAFDRPHQIAFFGTVDPSLACTSQ